ncbi:hypothetical protein [Brevundimonas sp. M20]|uniref:hypothetical protein n=1 Tax=Brevundimonas sp. M20 TaxID=2591463 RepID=UPI00143CEF57|nr:hypothetical protein [Brevundimonas sp. M20]
MALPINLLARAPFTLNMAQIDPKSANHGKPKVIFGQLKQTETGRVGTGRAILPAQIES